VETKQGSDSTCRLKSDSLADYSVDMEEDNQAHHQQNKHSLEASAHQNVLSSVVGEEPKDRKAGKVGVLLKGNPYQKRRKTGSEEEGRLLLPK
jgi:hypothetical protein